MTLKTEFLILIPNDESFCSNARALTDFLKVDSLISITSNKIALRKSIKGKDIVTAKFHIETDKVKSNDERFFIFKLECDQVSLVDEFSELTDKIKSIVERISPGSTSVNTLWDGVGRIYAEMSYPLINEVENSMRRLIAKFMLITVGMNWSKDAIHPELFKKIETFEGEDLYINDLHKLDFIHLSQVLFEKKRDITLEELDRILPKTEFSSEDQERIRKYVPRSNWEKYFSTIIDEKDSSLEKKWELLYKLRNKVAHNRNVKKEEFEEIKGLTNKIINIIGKAAEKLGEIDINDEDRELIKHSYLSESPATISYISEQAVSQHYIGFGHTISPLPKTAFYQKFDFLAERDGKTIGVSIKTITPFLAQLKIQGLIDRFIDSFNEIQETSPPSEINLVIVIRATELKAPLQILQKSIKTIKHTKQPMRVYIGQIDNEQAFNSLMVVTSKEGMPVVSVD